MKRILFILLTLVFLFEIGGSVFIFKSKQYFIRKEIKTRIKNGVPENELHTFVFSLKQLESLEWKHSREFRYGGMMYDIVRREVRDDGKHVLHCVSDKDEARLFVNLDRLTGRQMSKDLPFNKPFKELTRIFNTILSSKLTLELAITELTNSWRIVRSDEFPEGFINILSPPPELS